MLQWTFNNHNKTQNGYLDRGFFATHPKYSEKHKNFLKWLTNVFPHNIQLNLRFGNFTQMLACKRTTVRSFVQLFFHSLTLSIHLFHSSVGFLLIVCLLARSPPSSPTTYTARHVSFDAKTYVYLIKSKRQATEKLISELTLVYSFLWIYVFLTFVHCSCGECAKSFGF